jgi:hypothetical protein
MNLLFLAAVLTFFIAVLTFIIGNSPPKVVKYRRGWFWIKGFSDEYLASIKPRSAA